MVSANRFGFNGWTTRTVLDNNLRYFPFEGKVSGVETDEFIWVNFRAQNFGVFAETYDPDGDFWGGDAIMTLYY